ncbi:hypothetical protein EJ05DRAFT_472424 [Pseudovirgaria hyperparasitica]|uniref:Uncharacterized protein n=1 Tax=Pseudovirgaria hyperparasitica TaxID=470096 RepID=A0A6A6WMR7_9PEZI|nr:uncharacterized protein EJ05DRAFT_472424 [Pseudovirgaria hyperparasitica]KAF2763527.1 hypothetical protein EJ05DRAFT_472424 [Pseudovirgaria hyperparasitica]
MYVQLLVFTAAAVQASQTTRLDKRQQSSEPCAEAASYIEVSSGSPSGDIPAEIAYACLQSVPVDTDTDIQLIDEYKIFVEWQSTLSYLKDPPAGYDNPAVDVMGSLDSIKQKLQGSEYGNEYDVQNDIWRMVASTHDGHFNYDADILNVFTWRRSFGIQSLSQGNEDTPLIYAIATDSGSLIEPEITHINGQEVADFLNDGAQWTAEMDADARYNTMFPSGALKSSSPGGFRFPSQYVGPWTNVTFADGSEGSYANIASPASGSRAPQIQWDSVTDGQSLFDACCVLSTTSLEEKRSAQKPIIHLKAPKHNTVMPKRQSSITSEFTSELASLDGFYLDSNPDVAVISIQSFGIPDSVSLSHEEFPSAFQQEFLSFLQTAYSDGRTKMIVDLRGNGGGDGVLAWDAFRAFFPTTEPADVTRFRANDAYLLIGEGVKVILENESTQQNAGILYDVRDWNWQANLKPDGSHYTSAEELYGPTEIHGDNFTNLIRRDLSNPLSYGAANFSIIGYGANANAAVPLYNASDIIMLHDGVCHSTCAAFSEYMKNAGRVRSVVVGGRPQSGPMQAVAGTKGGFTFQAPTIQSFANGTITALEPIDPDKAQELGQTVLGGLASGTIGETLVRRQVRAQMNCEDNIQPGDEEMVPLQFVYEAADCRLYYTRDMASDPMEVWRRTAGAMWSGEACVADSTNHPSSLSGGDNYNADGSDGQPGDTGAGSVMGAPRSLLGLVLAVMLGISIF